MVIERVPSDQIEEIVGTKRSDFIHFGRADEDSHTFYILHSKRCLEGYGEDLRQCRYSIAMEHGIAFALQHDNGPVAVTVRDGILDAL